MLDEDNNGDDDKIILLVLGMEIMIIFTTRDNCHYDDSLLESGRYRFWIWTEKNKVDY